MAEHEAVLVVGDQDLGGNGLAQRGVQLLVLDRNQCRDRFLVHPSRDCDGAHHALGVFGEPLDPQHEGVTQRPGGGAAAVEARCEQLLGVQWVALAAVKQPLYQLLAWAAPRECL